MSSNASDSIVLEPELSEPASPRWRSSTVRRVMAGLLLLLVLTSVAAWYLTRDVLPPRIRIATAAPGGMYFHVGKVLKPYLERLSGRPVEVLETNGSVDNASRLLAGEADLAILQLGATSLDGLAPLAPLYQDVVQVIARRDSGIESFQDLAARRVAIGDAGSGMRASARVLLEHHRLDAERLEASSSYFLDLAEDSTLDAAIVTSGLLNPDLSALLASGEYHLIPLLSADALALRSIYFHPAIVPRGLYSEGPSIPPEDVPTVATSSVLVARADASSRLVDAALRALYEQHLQPQIPGLMTRQEAMDWQEIPLHPAALDFFQPFGGLGILANLMESLVAIKELLFALGAGLYLLWARWQIWQEKERAGEVQRDKDRLDVYLDRTIVIERQALSCRDPEQLVALIEEVTELKLQALDELTHEELRGDVSFSIFLQQCGDLIRSLQNRLALLRGAHGRDLETPP